MKLFLIRHGEPKIIDGDFYRCHLSEEGINQVKALATSGKIPKPDLILSSPYNRAKDTAKAFCEVFGMDFTIMDCLKEWNLQSLNLKEEYVEQEYMGWNDHNKVVEGGESLNNVKDRISKCMNELVKTFSSENILLVSHGTVIDMFCSLILGREAKISDIKNIGYLSYAILKYKNDKFNVIKDIVN